MSRKQLINPKVLASIDLSTASTNGDISDIQGLDGCAYLITWSGNAAVGTIKVQGSVYDPAVLVTQNFADLDLDPIAITGTTNSFLLNLSGLNFQKVRLVWTQSSAGAGTLKTIFMAKTVGA